MSTYVRSSISNNQPWWMLLSFNLFLTASSISALRGAAPQTILLTDDKSYSDTFGCFTSITMIGGTRWRIRGWKLNKKQIIKQILYLCIFFFSILNNIGSWTHVSQLMRLWYLSHRRPAMAQSRQSLRCSLIWSMKVDDGSDQKSDI